jgi:hypothetical protein
LVPLGDISIDDGHDSEFLGQVPGSRQQTELMDAGLQRLAGFLLQTRQQGIGRAQVSEDDLAGLSVDAFGGNDLPVAVSVDDFRSERGHDLVNTTTDTSLSRGSVCLEYSHYSYCMGFCRKWAENS